MNKLLYYPYMSIPKTEWLVQALLYWDGVATIVPERELQSMNNMTPFAKELIQDGVIESVLPEEYAYSRPDDYLTFLKWVKEHRSRFQLDNYESNIERIHVDKLNPIHQGKLSYLGSEFVRMGVARRERGVWYEMDKELIMCFMTFLAILIGQETSYIPTTDQYTGLSCLMNVDIRKDCVTASLAKNEFRGSILNRLLPVPSHVENFNEIIHFKEKYRDQLVKFRERIESFLSSLTQIPENERHTCCELFVQEAIDEIDDIKGKMGYFKWPEVNLGTLIAAMPSVYDLSKGDVVGSSVSIVPVIWHMLYNEEKKKNYKKPFAYAALFSQKCQR